ncbi:MAG: hypothetical protein GY749_26780 [Desulfobacteraceae bacterium]|nr:hypothetical protein [Desulfobacteraceae bacterium]
MKKILYISLLSILIVFVSGSTQAAEVTYIYDSLNRLARAEYGPGVYIEYIYDDAGNITRVTVNDAPLLSVVISFTAVSHKDRVLLEWKTASEPDNAGFFILRSDTEDGEYRQINKFMIPAEGNHIEGSAYSYADYDVRPGQTYYYKLEDVDLSGVSEYHEAVPGMLCSGICDPDAVTAGDINADNTVSIADVILVLQINAGMNRPWPVNLRAEINGNGKIGMEEAVYGLQVIAGIKNRKNNRASFILPQK